MPEPKSPFKRVRRNFERDTLKQICEMHETEFASLYGMSVTAAPPSSGWAGYRDVDYPDFYAHLDRGSSILAVAHLDTVVDHRQRRTGFLDTAAGPVVHSGALDDRLGAYTILELLPKLGVNVDVLLTTGEEQGNSTAQHFEAAKDYNWVIEFDRGGTDVVMYDYEEPYLVDMVRESGARVGQGSFSDIAYLEHLGAKAFNWGVGYQDYHSVRGYAYLEDYWSMVAHFLKFHDVWHDVELPHYVREYSRGSMSWLDEQSYDGWKWDADAKDWVFDEEWDLIPRDERRGVIDLDDPADEEPTDGWDEVVSEDFAYVNRQLLAAEGGQ